MSHPWPGLWAEALLTELALLGECFGPLLYTV
jgi:hypothetical protein